MRRLKDEPAVQKRRAGEQRVKDVISARKALGGKLYSSTSAAERVTLLEELLYLSGIIDEDGKIKG